MLQQRARPVQRVRRLLQRIWPLLVLALLCGAFFWDALFLSPEQILAGNDLANMFRHWHTFARSAIGEGRLPLWNPYTFSGQPFVANPQPALFYPPTWLSLLMPVTASLSWIVVLHVWLAGAGMYAWLRSEGTSLAGALFGAVIFAFSGYFFVRVQAGHLGLITTCAWLPVILWRYRVALTRRSWASALVAGLPVGLAFLAGHTASFVYVVLGIAAYATFVALEQWRGQRAALSGLLPLGMFAAMMLSGLALASVQLLPLAQLALRSTRQAGLGYEFAARFSWPPGYLLTLLVPNFFGEPAGTGYWGEGVYDEVIFYAGVLPLVLALLGLRLRHRLRHFLLALGLGALLLAFGQYGALHPLFYRWVPLFSLTRAPARAGFLFLIAAAALAGLTLSALETSTDEERLRLLRPMSTPLVLTVAGVAALLVAAGFGAYALLRETYPEVGRLWHAANRTAVFLLLFLLSASLIALWRRGRPHRIWLPALAIGVVLLDLWAFGGEVVHVVDLPENAYWRIVNGAVEDPDDWRVLPWGLNDFDQNGGMVYGLRSVFGYDPLILQRYQSFITSRPDPQAKTYDLLNARYLITLGPQDFDESPGTPQLVHEEAGVWIYERPTALPRAWIVPQIEVIVDEAALTRIHDPGFDPRATALVASYLECVGSGDGGEAAVLSDEGSRLRVQVQGGGGLLVLSDLDYPGWRATVDGNQTPVVRADYILRALCVPPGQHLVELTYEPRLPTIGLVISMASFVTIVALGTAWRRRKEKA